PFASKKSHLKDYGPAFLERLRRMGVAAMKQSFRATLPKVEPAVGFGELVERLRRSDLVVVGDPDGGRLGELPKRGVVTIVVGPEAGLTSSERQVLGGLGAIFVAASSHRLRAETAAVALTALVQSTWGS
ncbi:MAG: RsmE family RNA methyltransferase, partial [bacterium]